MVTGYNRVPDPPASMIPFRSVITGSFSISPRTFPIFRRTPPGLESSPQRTQPGFIAQVPAHRSLEADFQRGRCFPVQLRSNSRRVDGVSQIMPGSVGDEFYQIGVGTRSRGQFVHDPANQMHQIDIPRFRITADIVASADLSPAKDGEQRVGVILHVEPVANILSRAVDGYRFPHQRLQDHHWQKLFRKLERTIVVRTIRQQDGKIIGLAPGVAPGVDEMVGCRLGGGVGRAWRVGRGFGEFPGHAEGTEDFVGGNMEESEVIGPSLPRPVRPCRLEHVVSAHDIGLDEHARPVDRTVDVGFRRQVDDGGGIVAGEYPFEPVGIADIHGFEGIARTVRDRRHVLETGRIGQGVEIDHPMPRRDRVPHHRGPDESRPAGHQNFQCSTFAIRGRPVIASRSDIARR